MPRPGTSRCVGIEEVKRTKEGHFPLIFVGVAVWVAVQQFSWITHRDTAVAVSGRSLTFSSRSIPRALFAACRDFPLKIAGVATWVATFCNVETGFHLVISFCASCSQVGQHSLRE